MEMFTKHMRVPVLFFFVGLLLLTCQFAPADTAGAHVTPGIPACYLSLSAYQEVYGLFQRCSSTCTGSGSTSPMYIYCSVDYKCCWEDGCPACCTKRDVLYTGEIAGIVIGCAAFVAVVLGFAIFISSKFCSKG